MTVKELIKELKKMPPKTRVYLSDNSFDEEIYYYQVLDVIMVKVEEEKIVTLVYRP